MILENSLILFGVKANLKKKKIQNMMETCHEGRMF